MEINNKRVNAMIREEDECKYYECNYILPLLVGLFGRKGMDGGIRYDGKLSHVYYKKLFGKQHIYKTTIEWREE